MKKNKITLVLFFLFFFTILFNFISCSNIKTQVKEKKSFEEFIKDYPLFPLFYINSIETKGYLVIEKSTITDIKPGSYNFYFYYIKNKYFKFILNVKFLSKEIEILKVEFDFEKKEGSYNLMQEGYKKLDDNFLKDMNLDSDMILYFINNILLLFNEKQKDIIKFNEEEYIFNEFTYYIKNKLIQNLKLNLFIYFANFSYLDWKNYELLNYPQLIKFNFNDEISGSIIFNEFKYELNLNN